MTPLERLIATATELGREELEVLTLIADRLLTGQQEYGLLRLERDSRDFRREALEECADGMVYLACAALRARGASGGTGGAPAATERLTGRPRGELESGT